MTAGLLGGKVAAVTGGDTGIGKAIVQAFAREGASVVIDYHGDEAPARELAAEIERAGGRAAITGMDVTDPKQMEQLVKTAVDAFGSLDVMVNNAGIEEKHPFLETPLELFKKTIDVNLTGVWIGAQCAARQMVLQGRGGRIINISSVHEEITMPTNAAYCASKGGVRMLARTIAVELAEYGITVNNICPGAVDTPMDAPLKENPAEMRALLNEIPLKRMAQPSEIGDLAAFLASDRAAYITGASYVIDGGMTKKSGKL